MFSWIVHEQTITNGLSRNCFIDMIVDGQVRYQLTTTNALLTMIISYYQLLPTIKQTTPADNCDMIAHQKFNNWPLTIISTIKQKLINHLPPLQCNKWTIQWKPIDINWPFNAHLLAINHGHGAIGFLMTTLHSGPALTLGALSTGTAWRMRWKPSSFRVRLLWGLSERGRSHGWRMVMAAQFVHEKKQQHWQHWIMFFDNHHQ